MRAVVGARFGVRRSAAALLVALLLITVGGGLSAGGRTGVGRTSVGRGTAGRTAVAATEAVRPPSGVTRSHSAASLAADRTGGAERAAMGHGKAARTTRTVIRRPSPGYGHRRPHGADLTLVPKGWTISSDSLRAGGIERSYLMIRPPARVAGPLPVVVVLPGRSLDPDEMERMSGLIPIVGRAIMIFPAGYDRSWNAGGCCGVAQRVDLNDVAFLNEVIHRVLATQTDASAHDVYLLGFSNGGRMAYRMACADPDTFAGVAAVEAVPVYHCAHLDPTPLAIVAQSGDPLLTIPTHGPPKTMQGYLEPTVGATVQRYRTLEGCAQDSSLTTVGLARVTIFAHCDNTGRLEYILYRGGAHDWPGGGGPTPSAGQMIWSFLHHGGLPVLAHAGVRPGHHPVA
jgi:polyhydroxybutyrate depolymerase